jgi:two-component system, OmpR family, sensor histidine kinase BaeS
MRLWLRAGLTAIGLTIPMMAAMGWLHAPDGVAGALALPPEIWAVPVIGVVVAVTVATLPVARRIRRLTAAVESSASAGYTGRVAISGEDEVSELARAFDAASREVRVQLAGKGRREQVLRQFLANTTHDVMIPLTVLQGHLAAVQAKLNAGEAIDRAALVSAMDEAHYIASIVHNLAVVAKLDAGEPELQRRNVDLNALVNRVLGRHRPIARQLEVALNTAPPDEPLTAHADVTLLEQAVSNLVYNAIRHNKPGGHVAVLLEAAEDITSFRIRVVDDGPGIPAHELARITERGFRGDAARSRAPEGQGLGLHIAHRVAELHGFKLIFDKSEYGGLQVDLLGPRGGIGSIG